jgi:N-acetylglutamate synthase-like GNAT family acetyltransferase
MEIVKVKIKNLADCPQFAKTVAGWIHRAWAKESFEFDEIFLHMENFMQKDDIPQTFIAFEDDKPVGTVSLWRNDLKLRQDLHPWLSALWVSSQYRGNLVGHQLVKHAICQAEKLGYKKVYLVTDIIGYYEKMGWDFLGKEPKKHNNYLRLYSFDVKNKKLLDKALNEK